MSQAKLRILFVEDEEAAYVGLKAILMHLGHTVDVAETADQAVAFMQKTAYDLLLLDIMIDPGTVLNGVIRRAAGKELLLRLRSGQLGPLQTRSDVPTVAITAVADLGLYTALKGAEVEIILPKPIDPEDALQRIPHVMEREMV